jgi:hypothetical protein
VYSLPNVVLVIKSCVGEKRGAYSVLVLTIKGRGPLGRPRRRWNDKIEMDLQEVGCGNGLD